MAAPDAQQYVAQFEQCVAALQTGANAAQATKTLLALREDPRCLEIAQCVLAGSASREAQFHALTLFREGALQRWASLGAPQRSGAAGLALDFAARLDPGAEPFVKAAGDRGDVLCNALGALVQQFSGLENTLGVAKGLRDAARQRVETQALFDVAKIAFGARACAAPGDARDARRRRSSRSRRGRSSRATRRSPYDAAAAEGSNARPPWLHAVVAEVGASVFGRYARCRVEAARAQAAAGVLGELEEDASADDVAAGDARKRLETAAAVGRRHVAASCRALDELLTTALERVGALGAATDALEVDATLEEVVVLADLAGALLADDDSSGETVAVPLAIAAAARRDGDAAGAAAALLHKVLSLVQATCGGRRRRPSRRASPRSWRACSRPTRAPDAPPGPLGDFAAAAPKSSRRAGRRGRGWPRRGAGRRRRLRAAHYGGGDGAARRARRRRGRGGRDAAAAGGARRGVDRRRHAAAAGFRRAPPALRADVARACGDLALALDALGARHFEALGGAVARC
ncbi:hypothetical protein JL721_1976 [Aureococcus anophagefferens]|nr:hypothetical protein JL721_1976 [Aureococcus anophagefferens]